MTKTQSVKALLSQAIQYINHDKDVLPVLQDLFAVGYGPSYRGPKNLAFYAAKTAKPNALSQIMIAMPWLVTKDNAKLLFADILIGANALNVAQTCCSWDVVKQHFQPKKYDSVAMYTALITREPHAALIFDHVVKDVNLLSVGTGNKTILDMICGAYDSKLQPFEEHIMSVRALKSEKLNDRIEEISGVLAEKRVNGGKCGSYGSTLLELIKTNGGWISEEGCYLAAPGYNHILAITNLVPDTHPVMEWLKPRTSALEEYLEEETNSFFNNVSEGEHPGAHVIEIWASEQSSQFRQMMGIFLMNRGWVRLHNSYKVLHAEGTATALDRNKRDIEYLASIFNKGAKLNLTVCSGIAPTFSLPQNIIDRKIECAGSVVPEID